MRKLLYNKRHFLTRFILTGFLILAVSSTSPVLAQTSGSTLPPKAQAAYERGTAAAEQGEWALAVKYFNEAQKAAPESPEVLFNLAFACSNAGGRDILAIAWFRAYLAAAPDAPDAPEVRKEIVNLEVKVEAAMQKLIRGGKEMAAGIVDDDDDDFNWKSYAYRDIAIAQVTMHDMAGAKETVALIPGPDDGRESNVYSVMALRLADAGDFAGAKEAAKQVKAAFGFMPAIYWRGNAYKYIAAAQAKEGDIAGAKETATLIGTEDLFDDYWKSVAFLDVASAQAKSGNRAGAKESIEVAKRAGARITDADAYRFQAYEHIAQTQLDVGDAAGARESLAVAKEAAARIEWSKHTQYIRLAELQARAGDTVAAQESIALAKKAMAQITNDRDLPKVYSNIATAQAEAGDIAGAQESIALAKEAAARITGHADMSEAYSSIAKVQAKAGDIAGAQESIALAEEEAALYKESYGNARAYSEVAKAQAEIGDIRKACQTLELITENSFRNEAWQAIKQAHADTVTTENESWIFFALGYKSIPALRNLQNILKPLKDKDTEEYSKASITQKEAVENLADAATDMAEALRELQDNEVKWQELRVQSTP